MLVVDSVALNEFATSDFDNTSAAPDCRPTSRRYDVAPGTVVQEKLTGRSEKLAGTEDDDACCSPATERTGAVLIATVVSPTLTKTSFDAALLPYALAATTRM